MIHAQVTGLEVAAATSAVTYEAVDGDTGASLAAELEGVEGEGSAAATPSTSLAQHRQVIPLPTIIKDLPLRGPTDGSNWLLFQKVAIGEYPEGDDALALCEAGVSTFVCLQKTMNEYGFLSAENYQSLLQNKLLPKTVSSSLQFVHFPMNDHGAPPEVSALVELVLDLRSRVLSGQVLYLHCHGGHGRTGTVAIPLIASLCKKSGKEAQEFVVRATSTTRLNDAKKSGTLFDRMDAMPETGAQKRAAFFTAEEVVKLLWGR